MSITEENLMSPVLPHHCSGFQPGGALSALSRKRLKFRLLERLGFVVRVSEKGELPGEQYQEVCILLAVGLWLRPGCTVGER